MNQQFPGSLGFVIPQRGLWILGDIAAHQVQRATLDPTVGLVELAFATAQTFHFAALQHDAAFERIEYLELVAGFAILGHDARGRLTAGGRFRFAARCIFGFAAGRVGRFRFVIQRKTDRVWVGGSMAEMGEYD